MPDLAKLLLPVDFSERSIGAAHYARALALHFQSELLLVHVLAPLYSDMGGMEVTGSMLLDVYRTRAAGAETELEAFASRHLADVRVRRLILHGEPSSQIVELAQGEAVGAIMMPTHGYGPFRSLLVGSITAKVLHDAECPVWTATHVQEQPAIHHVVSRNLLCAVDGTPKSAPLIQWAAEYAKVAGATLRLVHAVSGVVAWPDRQLDQEFQETLRKEAREAIERLQRSIGVAAPLCVAVGEVAGVVRAEAERHDSDLILIGRGILHETMGRLRTHSYGIIRQAPCPVLSV